MNFKKSIFNFKIRYILRRDKISSIFNSNEIKSLEELKDLNFKKRKAIVLYAYMNIPFYKELYSSNGFNPNDLKSESDWLKIPVITRKDIKNNELRLKNPKVSGRYFKKSTTGGSTGEPLAVYFDKRIPLEIFSWRVLNWWGINPWENQAYVYRNIRKGIKKIINQIIWWPTKRFLLDCSSMDGNQMTLFINKINKYKPAFIQGYVGGIFDLAEYIDKNDIKINYPKAIWLTAAPFPESTRVFIEKVFEAPAYDQYGCSEVFWLAAECKKKNGLHFLSDIRHIEFLSENNLSREKGKLGDVVISDLENKVFPLIRYKNGDRGRFLNKECDCGLPFPLIDRIKGRISDNIRTPSGRIISGEYLTTIFDEQPDLVNAFQIIQQSNYSVDLNCILAEGVLSDNNYFKKIENSLRLKVKNEIDIRINYVDSLEQDEGKLKFITSKIK